MSSMDYRLGIFICPLIRFVLCQYRRPDQKQICIPNSSVCIDLGFYCYFRRCRREHFYSPQHKNCGMAYSYCMPQTVWTFNLRPKQLKRIGQNFYCAFRYLIWSEQPFETAQIPYPMATVGYAWCQIYFGLPSLVNAHKNPQNKIPH